MSPEPHVADSHDLIRVHGARVNNLKDVDLDINVCCAQDKCAADAQSMKATIDAFISSH